MHYIDLFQFNNQFKLVFSHRLVTVLKMTSLKKIASYWCNLVSVYQDIKKNWVEIGLHKALKYIHSLENII